MDTLGGVAHLRDIYDYAADRRPTQNSHWREQIRKVCRKTAKRVGRGRYALADTLELDLAVA
ncbi:hypothetical protein [Halomonas aquatica]|uniref:Uncharacterized protein n=1 Tax=Halomonas aquatica TaxID=3151123 RepID=A0ABV1NLA8_9GAMM